MLRIVGAAGQDDLAACLESRTVREYVTTGRLVRTEVLGDAARAELARAHPDLGLLPESARGLVVLEHERIPFPSYPYEWPPEMLHAAAQLTLDLSEELLDDGLGLKDGTPYNVLFRGPQPVFIDLLSIEKRQPGDPTWLPYAQFVRTFLLPLLANRHFRIPLEQVLAARRDGLESEDVYRWLSPLRRLLPPFLTLVSLPTWLGARHDQDDPGIYRKRILRDAEKARFILGAFLRRARRSLSRVAPPKGRSSTWSDYMDSKNYRPEEFAAKEAFLRQAMSDFAPGKVLDVGCNTGHFSVLAARGGASVVAIDLDPVVIGGLWRRASAERLDVLPLVVNLTRPTPAMGWRNQECLAFLDRARGYFDAVFLLAVIHHMLVSERIPLPDILALAAELTRALAVVEFIAPEDAMFRRLTRGRDYLHSDLTNTLFESHCRRHFEIVRSQRLGDSHRWLYLLRKTG